MHPSEPLIRKMTLADLNDLYALLSDSEVMRFIEPPFSKEQTAQFLMLLYWLCDLPRLRRRQYGNRMDSQTRGLGTRICEPAYKDAH